MHGFFVMSLIADSMIHLHATEKTVVIPIADRIIH